ncbi:hypothetical protein ACQR1Y_01570 [Bradyrhizobium sp. HKCCYLRH3099]|uniref:hypothetical protein n=1 Tax=unclassified Bradyrhizobium TaxID=2631580 RepID=UPI003EB6B842
MIAASLSRIEYGKDATMIIQIKAKCETNGSVLAAASYDDADQQDRATAIITLLQQVLAHSDISDEERLFTLDIESVPAPTVPSSKS